MKKRKKELTERQAEFCQVYSKNAGNIRRTCEELGINPSRAAALMELPQVKERLGRSVQIAKERLEAAAPHLVNLAMEIVNNEEVNIKVRASLLDSLLDRAGVTAPKEPLIQVNINHEIADRARSILAEREKGKGKAEVETTETIEAEKIEA